MRRVSRMSAAGAVAVGMIVALAACDPSGQPAPVPATRAATTRTATPSPSPTPTPTPTFDRSAHSIDDPTSLWVVVDKLRPLQPRSYEPHDLVTVDVPHTNPPLLRRAAATAVERLFAAAAHSGIRLASNSTYRSYADQRRVWESDAHSLGAAGVDRLDLRPGYSEHQTGLAIDIGTAGGRCDLDACFAGTPEGRWLARSAWRYGFLLRYPDGQEPVTGIEFEPWHFRYVGTALATEYHDDGATSLEAFFGLPPSPSYR